MLHGVGLFTALVVISELGDVSRFRRAKQVGAYTGLTARVDQYGSHTYSGHITRQGSPWLRHVLVEAAMKIVRDDIGLANFYARVRKRSSAKIARVAVARKLAEICWRRLVRWQHEYEMRQLPEQEGGAHCGALQSAGSTRKFVAGETQVCTVDMSGCPPPVNRTLCDSASWMARMGDYERASIGRQAGQ